MAHLLLATILHLAQIGSTISQCFNDQATNTEWAQLITEDDTATEIPIDDGSCCQETVCGLPCPAPMDPPAKVSWRLLG